ncbi:ankyrin repeat and protein kinase domain-containing protein 1-like [Aethina tumida]|uniref:ankyrin repeat and protein kinase domain-containing protein 1-like n=1 Tax=Aethina tumida TaxID=116153 RepID=UPI00096AFF4E|nr:ankyrin repeat and protein kinase domain-containing protein 1-like [Aethina tumida]
MDETFVISICDDDDDNNNITDVAPSLDVPRKLINIPDENEETPIFHAVRLRNLKALRSLYLSGADLSHTNKLEQSLLHICDDRIILAQLFKYNISNVNKPSIDGSTPLHNAIFLSDYDIVELLLKNKAKTNITDVKKRSPLHLAVMNDCYEIAELLINSGADVNAADEEKQTPLHYAVQMNQKNFVDMLLKHKGTVKQTDIDGYTPLHVAACKGNKPIIKMLLNRYPKGLHLVTYQGDTPLDLAERFNKMKEMNLVMQELGMKSLKVVCDKEKVNTIKGFLN